MMLLCNRYVFPGSHKIYCMPVIRSVQYIEVMGTRAHRDRERTKIGTTAKYKRFPDQKKIRSVYIAQWEMTKI